MSCENTNDNLYESLVKLSQLRERNNNAQDALRLERMLEDHRKAAREENQRIYEENKAILCGLFEPYMIENHGLMVEAVENEDEDDEDRFEWVIHSFIGGSAFVEFAVKNSELDEITIESVREEMLDADGFDFDDLLDLYHELCNAPVLK